MEKVINYIHFLLLVMKLKLVINSFHAGASAGGAVLGAYTVD